MKQAILIVLAVLCLRTVTYGQAVTVTASAIKPNPNVAAPSGACPRRNAVLIDASTIYVCPESGAQNWTAVSGGGGGGVTIGTTTITGGTNTGVLYNNSGVFGSAPINVNALNSTYLDITSAASGFGLTLAVAGGGTNENLSINAKGTGFINLNPTGNGVVINQGALAQTSAFSTVSWNNGLIGWSSSGSVLATSTPDTAFSRHGVAVVRVNNGSTGAGQLLIGQSTDTVSAQLDVRSQSTTRPAARFQAASGTSGSQEMLGVYDGSGALAASFSADGSLRWGSSSDTILTRDAANTLAQRNGVNAQAFRVYNTYTDASNYERLNIEWAANIAFIRTSSAGTGTARGLALNAQGDQLYFQTGNTTRWRITSSGHLLAEADNTYDIGASGATRPRNVYVGNNVVVGNALTVAASISAGSGGIQLNSGPNSIVIASDAAGNLKLTDAGTGTTFDRLQFGGTSASFPALKRSGAGLQVRLADDTGYASLIASAINVAATTTGFVGNSGGFGPGMTVQSNSSNSHAFTQYRFALLNNASTIEWASGGAQSAGDLALARPAAKVLGLNDGASAGASLRAVPDSPTQLTADQNNYTGGTGRSLFYRLSSDASRTITGFDPAGGTNQDGELHYFINVGANNIVLANESALSTAANRFTNVTGADITLAANEMAMLVYDATSARWRVAKM